MEITIENADCVNCPASTNICEAPPDYQCTIFRKKYTEQMTVLANELLNKIYDCADSCPLYTLNVCNGKPDKECIDMLIDFARKSTAEKQYER